MERNASNARQTAWNESRHHANTTQNKTKQHARTTCSEAALVDNTSNLGGVDEEQINPKPVVARKNCASRPSTTQQHTRSSARRRFDDGFSTRMTRCVAVLSVVTNAQLDR